MERDGLDAKNLFKNGKGLTYKFFYFLKVIY